MLMSGHDDDNDHDDDDDSDDNDEDGGNCDFDCNDNSLNEIPPPMNNGSDGDSRTAGASTSNHDNVVCKSFDTDDHESDAEDVDGCDVDEDVGISAEGASVEERGGDRAAIAVAKKRRRKKKKKNNASMGGGSQEPPGCDQSLLSSVGHAVSSRLFGLFGLSSTST
mmetsp:Transcript_3709/g.6866  ORF Transcript_3709/g.6866 Transcript_3709/m.6866 type:complete len:166 (-) Transcript_3709:275-772(-)